MLAIRMQRKGRKGQAFFRLIVQESRLSPSSGKIVAQIGTYNPHDKEVVIDAEKVKFYLNSGAQPSDSMARLLRSQKIELPNWVKIDDSQKRAVRNPEKLRKNQPAEEVAPVEESPVEEVSEEVPAEAPQEKPAEETPGEETPAPEEKAE